MSARISTPSPGNGTPSRPASESAILRGRDGAVKGEAEVAFDDVDEGLQRRRVERDAGKLPQLLQVPAPLHQRELVPSREIRVVPVRDRQDLVHGAIDPALAETRRHDAVDDPEVERVAGDPDARMPERVWPCVRRDREKAHHREVAGAAAEIRHQHGGVVVELRAHRRTRRHGFVHIGARARPQLENAAR